VGSPAQALMTPAAAVAAEPVPVAFLGRTSTASMQDPRASLRRQLRSARGWLPAGWFIAAVYWDIESGGIDLETRSQGDAYREFTGADLPRDGGMADLLREAASPAPRFAAVVCEDIERSGRDMFNALKLEKELSRQGIPLFATDEPADIEGVNATTVLVRRVKQGVAEWYRLQLKEKIWKGLVEHSLDGWNIGAAPYGYAAQRIEHPVAFKAAQGRTKSRLILDPARAPIVAQIFTWRVVDKLGMPAIAARLNASPVSCPAPGSAAGWTAQPCTGCSATPSTPGTWSSAGSAPATATALPSRRTSGCGHPSPSTPPSWTGTPGKKRRTSPPDTPPAGTATSPTPTPPTLRTYIYRSRVRCRDCERRMTGRTNGRHAEFTYYRCPHDPANPRHIAAQPDHPRTVPETSLDKAAGIFFATRIFGPDRARLLAEQLPATDADATDRRDTQAAALKARIKQIDTAQDSKILELEQLPADPADTAMRARIRTRFAELHHEREHVEAQLKTLDKTAPAAADPALLDRLPLAGDILPDLPPALKARLLAAFD
jgi:site-specific DNA recombinase